MDALIIALIGVVVVGISIIFFGTIGERIAEWTKSCLKLHSPSEYFSVNFEDGEIDE